MAATINLSTGKIVGCKKGSFAWWHEKGHMVYNNSEFGLRRSYLQEMWLYVAITMAILSIPFRIGLFWLLALVSIISFWWYFIYEERWCNAYARIKLRKGGKKNVYKEKSSARD